MPILLCMLPLRSLLLTSSFCLDAQRYFSLSSKSNSFIRTWLSVDYLGSIFPVHKEHFQYVDLNLLLLPECFCGFKFKYYLSYCFFLLRNSNFTYHLYKSFSLWFFTFLHLIFILLAVFIFFSMPLILFPLGILDFSFILKDDYFLSSFRFLSSVNSPSISSLHFLSWGSEFETLSLQMLV